MVNELSVLYINFHLNNEFTLIYASFVLPLNIDKSSDGIGIMFAPMCKLVSIVNASQALTKRYVSIR